MEKSAAPGSKGPLEQELQTELQGSATMSVGRLQEAGASQRAVNAALGTVSAAELRMVEEVERFHTEFKSGFLVDLEIFQKRGIKVKTAGYA